MKSALAFSFLSLSSLFTLVSAAPQSSITLFAPPSGPDFGGPTLAESVPSTIEWVEPLGTAPGGGETTYVYNEILSEAAEAETTSLTLIASASGFKIPDIQSASAECTLAPGPNPNSNSNTAGCIFLVPLGTPFTDLDGTPHTGSFLTITETDISVSLFEIAISSPTASHTPAPSGTATSEPTGFSSGSGSGSSAVSSPTQTGSSTVGDTGNKNGALSLSSQQTSPRILGLVAVGLLAGTLLVG